MENEMKKTKQVDTYYCDCCGKECEHTDITLPSLEREPVYAMNGMSKLATFSSEILEIKQKDICPKCQHEIAKFLNLMKYTTVKIDDVEKTVFDNFYKAVSNKNTMRYTQPKVETSNGRNCRDCNKSNVCKYQEVVVEEVEKLVVQVKKLELPLSININCKEWTSKVPNPRGE